MPLYEYECRACGNRFEQIQKFSDPPVEKCPVCGAPRVRKLMSSPAIQFKGSGWYITDYAKKDQPAAKGDKGEGATKPDSADAKPDAKSDAKTESKRESKSESKAEGASPSRPASANRET